jgi:hypothetical protein
VSWQSPEPQGRRCSRLCNMQTGAGCPTAEFCTNPHEELLDGLGYCIEACSPARNFDCPSGQTCGADPNFPVDACHPHFRCLDTGGGLNKSPGDSCSRETLDENGCASSLVCFPDPRTQAQDDDACVKPCSTDTDCASGVSCKTAAAPWDSFKYCAL